MKILVINGPNLNMLGIREPEIYGKGTLAELEALIAGKCGELGIECEFFQSNHEGAIIDRIQEAYGKADGILINPGGYTHTSIVILDALKAVGLPTVEVHISDINGREPFRRPSYVSYYALKTITGKGFDGYLEGVDILAAYDRITRMEKIMERVEQASKTGAEYDWYKSDVDTLSAYYSGYWRKDFEMDEEGIFPEDMKRGVLSEDGLYDLLEEAEK